MPIVRRRQRCDVGRQKRRARCEAERDGTERSAPVPVHNRAPVHPAPAEHAASLRAEKNHDQPTKKIESTGIVPNCRHDPHAQGLATSPATTSHAASSSSGKSTAQVCRAGGTNSMGFGTMNKKYRVATSEEPPRSTPQCPPVMERVEPALSSEPSVPPPHRRARAAPPAPEPAANDTGGHGAGSQVFSSTLETIAKQNKQRCRQTAPGKAWKAWSGGSSSAWSVRTRFMSMLREIAVDAKAARPRRRPFRRRLSPPLSTRTTPRWCAGTRRCSSTLSPSSSAK